MLQFLKDIRVWLLLVLIELVIIAVLFPDVYVHAFRLLKQLIHLPL